jgi:CheY-like chemotaxis protein
MVRILLCDDELTTRFVLKRFLTKEVPCTITEADNGTAALKLLAKNTFDLLILDLNMPVMDGRTALRRIRETPKTHDLPVVILSGENDERAVKQVISLGVETFLLKPVTEARAQARLRAVLSALKPSEPFVPLRPAVAGPLLEPNRPVLVADADPELRKVVTSVLGSRFEMHESASGPDALNQIVRGRICTAFIGRNLPELKPDVLAAKVVTQPGTKTRLIAIAPPAEADAVRATGLYDAVITRTLAPAEFERQIDALLQGTTPSAAAGIGALVPGFSESVGTAVQQLFDMVLKMEAERRPDGAPIASGSIVRSDVRLSVADTHDVVITLIADIESAKAFSVAMMGTEAPDDALYEMLNIVGGRIKQAVTATGRDAILAVPNVEMLEDAPVPPLSPACLVLAFGVQGKPYALTVICDADPPARQAVRAAS